MGKIDFEKRVVAEMIGLYCRRQHGGKSQICAECADLLAYAHSRLTHCPHGESKPSCRRCPVHCYSPSHRRAIATVMRYSGPRMLLRHPLTTLRHLLNL